MPAPHSSRRLCCGWRRISSRSASPTRIAKQRVKGIANRAGVCTEADHRNVAQQGPWSWHIRVDASDIHEGAEREQSKGDRYTHPPSSWTPACPPCQEQDDQRRIGKGRDVFDVRLWPCRQPLRNGLWRQRMIRIRQDQREQINARRAAAPENLRCVELAVEQDARRPRTARVKPAPPSRCLSSPSAADRARCPPRSDRRPVHRNRRASCTTANRVSTRTGVYKLRDLTTCPATVTSQPPVAAIAPINTARHTIAMFNARVTRLWVVEP